jgi:phosphoglycerol transferase
MSDTPTQSTWKSLGFAAFQGLLVSALSVFLFNLWRFDFSVPFNYWGDTLWYLVPIKGLLDHGWTIHVPELSAPFTLNTAAFPSLTTIDWSIMKAIAAVTGTEYPGVVLNVFWLTSIVLTGWTAAYSLHRLQIGPFLSIAGGTLYAFLPFALLRNTGHISLVYYTVPLLCLLAVYLADWEDSAPARRTRTVGYVAAVLQGFNYIYFSFFAVLLFLFSGLLGYRRTGSVTPLKAAVFATALVTAAAALNMIPAVLSWHQGGTPPNMDYKHPAEAEIYALKIRKLLSPHERSVYPLSAWGQWDAKAAFPHENENTAARLGPFAAIGLILLLLVALGLYGREESDLDRRLRTLSSLALLSLLVTTVGGAGAILNVLTVPDIRAYNRFSVFIAFFAVAALALIIEHHRSSRRTAWGRVSTLAAFGALVLVSLYDQLQDATPLVQRRAGDVHWAAHERQFVTELERLTPAGTAIFQLPVTTFPPDGGLHRMLPYDHARPYLWSSHTRWSWPSFSRRHAAWLQRVRGLSSEELLEALALSGFGLIWVDRYGFVDQAEQLLSELSAAGAVEVDVASSHRYVVLDLRPTADRLTSALGHSLFQARRAELLDGVWLDWVDGVYGEERAGGSGVDFRWSRAASEIRIHNPLPSPRRIELAVTVASGGPGDVAVIVEGVERARVSPYGEGERISLLIHIPPSGSARVRFVGNTRRIPLPPGETRDLHFALMDVVVHDMGDSAFSEPGN